MKKIEIHNSTFDIRHSYGITIDNFAGWYFGSSPSYQISCNRFIDLPVGIQIQPYTAMNDLGSADRPAANTWINVPLGINVHPTFQPIVGDYYRSTDENVPISSIIINVGNLNKFNSCK